MFAFCDRMDKEGGIGTGWRKEKEAEWLARTLKTEVAPSLSAEIGNKEFSLVNGGRRKRTGESHARTPGEEVK